MQVHTFIAESASDAVAQIRAQLGPQAVVLNVRPLPAEGLSRLWQKRRIEVLACLPAASGPVPEMATEALAVLRQEMLEIRQKVDAGTVPTSLPDAVRSGAMAAPPPFESVELNPPGLTLPASGDEWRVGAFLETSGLMPVHAARLVEELRAVHGDAPPSFYGRELEFASALLRRIWHRTTPGRPANSGAHVLIGPPGVGKTVCLCKWLAQTVLLEGRRAAVWRLDSRIANTAESLSVYGEILGTPVERSIPAEADGQLEGVDLLLIDLPGVSAHEPGAIEQLAQELKRLPNPQVHLVLNAAYELPLLQAQLRAFSVLPLAGLIFTHLDEETRWGKLWNFVLGTNCSIRFLSAGQNIPGDWIEATPEQILARQFPRK